MEDFPDRLKAARQKLNLTQDEMGDRLGVTGNYVYVLEAGRKKPSDSVVTLLSMLESSPEDRHMLFAGTRLNEEPATYMPHNLKTTEGLKKQIHQQSTQLLHANQEESLLITATMRRALEMLDRKLEEGSE